MIMQEVTTESIIKDLSEKRLKAKSLMKEKAEYDRRTEKESR
jgi:hypothetical protein